MIEASLNDIMNNMAEGMEPLSFCPVSDVQDAPQKLDEFEAFMTLDETLSTLNKEYLDAKSHHDYLIKTFGVDDAMAEVAADMMDSAWCAMQTRYLEVRAQRCLMERAQQMMRESEQACEDAQEKKEIKKTVEQAERVAIYARYLEKMNKAQEKSSAYLLFVFVLLFGLLRFDNMLFNFKSNFNAHRHAAAA